MERQDTCWTDVCLRNAPDKALCRREIFDCAWQGAAVNAWYGNFTTDSNVFCNYIAVPMGADTFNYGIYNNAISNTISSSDLAFSQTYFFCLWQGLLALRYVHSFPCFGFPCSAYFETNQTDSMLRRVSCLARLN